MSQETQHHRGLFGQASPILVYTALFLLLAVAIYPSAVLAQQTNPLASDPRAAAAGGVIFRAQCATCHGADAKGISSIDAPDLTLMWTQPGISENRVFSRIQEGRAGQHHAITRFSRYRNLDVSELSAQRRCFGRYGRV